MSKLDDINESLTADIRQLIQERLFGGRAPNPKPYRTPPPQDIYDQDYAAISPIAHFSPGRTRPMWNQPEVAVTHTPISSWLNSGQAQNTQVAQIIGGVTGGVKAPATGFAPVPNMQVVIKANGPIHLVASLTVQSTQASDNISFAFYRRGILISQIFTHTTPSAANNPDLVSLSMIDSDLDFHSPLNFEQYALYWKAGTGTLSTVSASRSLYAINLTPQ